MRIKKRRIDKYFYYLGFTIYKIMLDVLYIYGTSKVYNYLGRDLDFSLEKYILGWIAYCALLIAFNKIRAEGIRFMVKIAFALTGTANMSMYGLRNYKTGHFLIAVLYWILIILTCIYIPKIKGVNKFFKFKGQKKIAYSGNDNIILIIGILITAYEVLKFGRNVTSITAAYLVRSEFRGLNISAIDTYLLSWNATVFLPWSFLMMFGQKKYVRAGIALLCGVFMFQINGMKTWLLLYAVIVCFVLFMRNTDFDKCTTIIALGISAVVLFSLVVYLNTPNYSLVGYSDRIICLPGETNYYYLDFFDTHEHLLLRESILRAFFKSPYDPISSIQIGQQYLSAAFYHNSTNGMLGDCYANFGIFGLLIYPTLLSFAFIILDNITNHFEIYIKKCVVFILIWTVINTPFFTWLLTGGYLIYIGIMFVYIKYSLSIKKAKITHN